MGVVGDGSDSLGCVALKINDVSLTRLDRLSLQVNRDTLLLSLTLLGSIFLDTVDEIFTRARVSDVFQTDTDALLDVAVADDLVQDDSERRLGHIVYNTSLAVVPFVGHTVIAHLSNVVLKNFHFNFGRE